MEKDSANAISICIFSLFYFRLVSLLLLCELGNKTYNIPCLKIPCLISY